MLIADAELEDHLRDGVRAEDAYNERKVARRPAIPRKIFASVLTGVGVGLLIFGGSLWQDARIVTQPQRPAQLAATQIISSELRLE